MYCKDVKEMRMLMWKCGKTFKDKIRNERFREHLVIASIGDTIGETRLRRFGHVQCRPTTTLIRKSLSMQVDSRTKERGRPKRKWMEVVKIDLKNCNLYKNLTQNKLEWRNKTYIAYSNIVGARL